MSILDSVPDHEATQWAVQLPGRGWIGARGFDYLVVSDSKDAVVKDNRDEAVKVAKQIDDMFAVLGVADVVIHVVSRQVRTFIDEWNTYD